MIGAKHAEISIRVTVLSLVDEESLEVITQGNVPGQIPPLASSTTTIHIIYQAGGTLHAPCNIKALVAFAINSKDILIPGTTLPATTNYLPLSP